MFMGHLGIALGAKGLRSDVSLLLLCVAATAPDLIDFALEGEGHAAGAGLWTHSFAAMFGSTLLFGMVYWLVKRQRTAALCVGTVAASHVLADLITSHMVLWRDGPPIGLHLYAHRVADLLLESGVILVGWWLYKRSLFEARRFSWAAWAMLPVLLGMQCLMATMNVS